MRVAVTNQERVGRTLEFKGDVRQLVEGEVKLWGARQN